MRKMQLISNYYEEKIIEIMQSIEEDIPISYPIESFANDIEEQEIICRIDQVEFEFLKLIAMKRILKNVKELRLKQMPFLTDKENEK